MINDSIYVSNTQLSYTISVPYFPRVVNKFKPLCKSDKKMDLQMPNRLFATLIVWSSIIWISDLLFHHFSVHIRFYRANLCRLLQFHILSKSSGHWNLVNAIFDSSGNCTTHFFFVIQHTLWESDCVCFSPKSFKRYHQIVVQANSKEFSINSEIKPNHPNQFWFLITKSKQRGRHFFFSINSIFYSIVREKVTQLQVSIDLENERRKKKRFRFLLEIFILY